MINNLNIEDKPWFQANLCALKVEVLEWLGLDTEAIKNAYKEVENQYFHRHRQRNMTLDDNILLHQGELS